jgi:RHS repeat-associated protein
VRAQKSSACNSSTFGDLACKSFIERTVWDGDEILLERRADGATGLTSGQLDSETSSGESWGEVISLHANGIDAPISVRKTGRTTLVPRENWQGDYEIGTTADGTPTSLCNGATNCPLIEWPGGQENADGLMVNRAVLNTWWGSLISEKLDASGMKYMRNRYYSPETGQFTQQDPIGLAGGLNLYGFAQGDPVNFSDPLGLYPCCLVIGLPHSELYGAVQQAGDEVGSNFMIDVGGGGLASTERAGAELAVRAFSRVGTKLAGELGAIDSRVSNIVKELNTHDHFDAARLERAGIKTFGDHRTELEYFTNGLRNSAIRLQRMLGMDGLSPELRSQIQGTLSRVSKLRDEIMDGLSLSFNTRYQLSGRRLSRSCSLSGGKSQRAIASKGCCVKIPTPVFARVQSALWRY